MLDEERRTDGITTETDAETQKERDTARSKIRAKEGYTRHTLAITVTNANRHSSGIETEMTKAALWDCA